VDNKPSITCVILNWNGAHDTLACLESLTTVRHPHFSILVVDNGSTDDSVKAIQNAFPDIELIETGENLGFAAGNNVGLRHALAQGAGYALLLNNDTVVDPDFVGQLAAIIKEDDSIGIVGPTIYYHSHPNTIWSAGGAIDWQRGKTWMVGLDEKDNGQFGTTPRPVDFVTGCALMISRRALESAGLLDERFFMYYEETEWCVRVTRAGFGIRHVPAAHIWHKIAPQAQAVSPFVHYYMTRNRLLFLKVTNAGLMPRLYTLTEYSRTLLSWSLRPRWRRMRGLRGVIWQAMGDYYRGQFGRAEIRTTERCIV
jgi:GT2 family glycosyltransferase